MSSRGGGTRKWTGLIPAQTNRLRYKRTEDVTSAVKRIVTEFYSKIGRRATARDIRRATTRVLVEIENGVRTIQRSDVIRRDR